MNRLAKHGFQKTVDEERVSRDGIPYRARKWEGGGRTIELNQDAYGYHARADHDPKTTQANMDAGGLFGWLMRIFGG